nr:MAG TPA: hypothetical protein [Caudoviricetes sp.]
MNALRPTTGRLMASASVILCAARMANHMGYLEVL